MSKHSQQKYLQPHQTSNWIQWGDLFVTIVIAVIFVLTFFQHGLVLYDQMRGVVFGLCGVVGIWGLIGFSLGRFADEEMKPARYLVCLLLLITLFFGLQNLPFSNEIALSLNQPGKQSFDLLEGLGYSISEKFSYSQSPVKALLSWNQLFASFCFFLGTVMLCRKRKNAYRLLLIIFVVGVIETVFSFVRILSEDLPRVAGSLINPNHHAALVIVGLFAGLGIFLRWQRDKYGSVFAFLRGTNPGSLLALTFLIMVASWLGSLSRGSIFFGVLTLSWYVFQELKNNVSFFQSDSKTRAVTLLKYSPIFAGIVIVVLVLLSPILQSTNFIERVEERIEYQDSAVVDFGRLEMSRATLEALMESPVAGLGLAGTNHGINRFERTDSTMKAIWSHNDYVQFVAELGLPMTLICLAFLIWAGFQSKSYVSLFFATFPRPQRDLYRTAGCAFAVVMAHAIVDFHLRIPTIGFVTLILLALCITPGLGFYAAARESRRNKA